jgi:protein involved in polysaccharide export with SLBB domain
MRFYVIMAMIFFLAAGATAAESTERKSSVRDIYTLGSGDRVKVTVYGEHDLSGTFEISGTGAIAYPLIGEVEAGGKTVRELETAITRKLRDGYLRKPRVGIEVINYRPFYILGEVKRPGSYAYVEGMKIVNAVAMSGGFTYRARKQELYVRRAGAPKDSEVEANPDDLLYPGDVIRVPERFF